MTSLALTLALCLMTAPPTKGKTTATDSSKKTTTKKTTGTVPAPDAAKSVKPVIVPPSLIGSRPKLVLPYQEGTVPTKVKVTLVVDLEGKATDIRLLTAAGKPFEARIKALILKTRFKPALRDGKPVRARIRWTIRLAMKPKPIPTYSLTGVVKEKGTRQVVAGQALLLEGTTLSTSTDAQGRFSFQGIKAGKYQVVATELDYKEVRFTVVVPKNLTIELWLIARRTKRYLSVAKPPAADASRIVVSAKQAAEIPGSAGDPIKVVEILPGIARPSSAGPGAGQIVVRGSAPEDTRFYIDGMPIPQLYHFGNIYSVLQDEWIRNVTFRPGGFSAEYGDATGGILGVELAPLRKNGIHGHVDINVYHAAALLTVPVSKSWTLGVGFRRSYVDAFLGAVIPPDSGFAFSAAPTYYDYQLTAEYNPDPSTRLRILWYGSDDGLSILLDQPTGTNPDSRGFELARYFHQGQATLRKALSRKVLLFAGIATGYQTLRVAPSDITSFELNLCPLILRTDISWQINKKLSFRGGLYGSMTRARIQSNLPRPTKEGEIPDPSKTALSADEGVFVYEPALWSELQWRPMKKLTLTTGLRLLFWAGSFNDIELDPRVTLKAGVTPTTVLTLAGGMNHQAPFYDERSESYGNPELNTERSIYGIVGVSQSVGNYLTFNVQGFYKSLDRLVSPTNDYSGQSPPYDSAGAGYAFGAELLVRLNTEWVDAWVSYTLQKSRRKDRPEDEERPFSYDQTHVLALVAGANLGRGWRLSTRFRYATGNPYTPLEAAYFDGNKGVYVPRPSAPRLSERLPDFMQLDVRIDKSFVFNSWKLKLYLELTNATNRANVEQVGYSNDYATRQDIVGLPILPSLGIRGMF
jgi:hypothetical protein